MPAGQICDANKQEKAERDQYIALTGCHRSQAPLKFPFRKFQPATEQALPDRLLMWVQPAVQRVSFPVALKRGSLKRTHPAKAIG
jgi:hypothetical protein